MAVPIEISEVAPLFRAWLFAALKTLGATLTVAGLPILSAVLMAHAFPPNDLGWIAWVGLVPLCLVIPGSSWTFERYFGAVIAGLTFYGIGLRFIDTLSDVLPSASPGQFRRLWLAATVLGIWVWPLTILIARQLSLRCGFPLTAGFPIAWVIVEHARHWFSLVLFGNECPWLHLGYSQVEFCSILQVAALGGMGLISFLLCSVNAALAVVIHSVYERAWPNRRECVGMIMTILGLWVAFSYGLYQLQPGPTAASSVFRVGLVPRANMIAHAGSEVAILKSDLKAENSRPHLLLYGENTIESISLPPACSAVGETKSDPGRWEAILADVSREMGTYLVVGATRSTRVIDGDQRHVCAVLVSPEKGLVAWSDKSALVPFAESSPPWAEYPVVRRLLGVTDKSDDFAPSARMSSFAVSVEGLSPPIRLGTAICYDVSSTKVFQDAALRSDAFLVLGNEPIDPRRCTPSWLLNMARCRAVESRRAIARTSIGGTSCMINCHGQIEAALPRSQTRTEGSMLVAALPISGELSLYGRSGDWPTYFGFVITALSLISRQLISKRIVDSEPDWDWL